MLMKGDCLKAFTHRFLSHFHIISRDKQMLPVVVREKAWVERERVSLSSYIFPLPLAFSSLLSSFSLSFLPFFYSLLPSPPLFLPIFLPVLSCFFPAFLPSSLPLVSTFPPLLSPPFSALSLTFRWIVESPGRISTHDFCLPICSPQNPRCLSLHRKVLSLKQKNS